jgi:malate dehydrogenase (oxaloacetate-decarboxylating)
VGAAGNAIARLLTLSGAKNIIGFNHHGVIHNDMKSEDPMQQWFIDNSNPHSFIGTMPEALVGADVFIGVSAPNILKEADISTMAKGSIIFALANPDPEVDQIKLTMFWHFLESSVDYSMLTPTKLPINY